MTKSKEREPSLHDWLSLGEIEKALSPKTRKNEDLLRLPLLLRLLAASQPLSCVPSILGDERSENSEGIQSDPVVNEVVSKLEDVAATYSAAGDVDALVSYLAPIVTQKIGKLAPLKRIYSTSSRVRKRKWDGLWATQELAKLAAAPVGLGHRKRSKSNSNLFPGSKSADEIVVDNDDEDDEMDDIDSDMHQIDSQKSLAKAIAATTTSEVPRDSQSFLVDAAVVAEDSQESMVIKTLSEIASLVVASLEPFDAAHDEDGEKSNGHIALPIVSDSLLSDAGPGPDAKDRFGAIGGSDLGATIASLMHLAPVLRYRHVANALCRVATPQTADLIAQMAANCQAVSPCLIRGCLDAYYGAHVRSSTSQGCYTPVSNAAIAAVRKVAFLSRRESARVAATLQQSSGAMVDLQLELSFPEATAVAFLLIEHLSKHKADVQGDTKTTGYSSQPASDTMIDTAGKRSHQNISTTPHPNGYYQFPSLHKRLMENHPLVIQSCNCLLEELASIFKTGEKYDTPSWGQVALLLRAYASVQFRVDIDLGSSSKETESSRAQLVGAFWSAFDRVFDKLSVVSNRTEGIPPKSAMDRSFQFLVCCFLVTCSRCPTSDKVVLKRSLERIMLLSISHNSEVYVTRIAGCLKARNVPALHKLIADTLRSDSGLELNEDPMDNEFESGLRKTCTWAFEHLHLEPAIRLGVSDSAIMEDVTALVESIEFGNLGPSQVQDIVQGILSDPIKCKLLVQKDGVCNLIEEAVIMLTKQPGPKLPVILPIKLEVLGGKVQWLHYGEKQSLQEIGYQFLLQLLYCLHFLDLQPDSPFAIDPMILPLAETLYVCSTSPFANTKAPLSHFSQILKGMIERHCPDATLHAEAKSTVLGPVLVTYLANSLSRQNILQIISNAIRYCLEDKSTDHSGAGAENIYFSAQTRINSRDVDTTAIRALLSSRNSPVPYVSYASLCRDPLVLLNCSVSVWKCRGLRRIALNILNRLMCANDNLIMNNSPTEDSALELLAARNSVVLRCLLVAVSGGFPPGSVGNWKKDEVPPLHCSTTLNMIRALVVRQHGLVATVVRQGISNTAVDWLIEFVPETMNDASILKSLLSGSTLTASELLTTADAFLRIAMVHGSSSLVDGEAQALAHAALSVMVSSFFLVIGPVGVPVNVVCGDGGPDVTQVCRKALLRMLTALQKMNGRNPGVNYECGLALQKIAGLCKGETILSGVSGVVAVRRKHLLKEIWDAVVKAINAMGGGIQI